MHLCNLPRQPVAELFKGVVSSLVDSEAASPTYMTNIVVKSAKLYCELLFKKKTLLIVQST